MQISWLCRNRFICDGITDSPHEKTFLSYNIIVKTTFSKLQISLALTPPILLSASWLTDKQNYPGKVILTVALSSSLLMVLFCSFEDEFAHYKMLFHHGVLGLIMSVSLAFFIVCAKQSLAKVCIMIEVVLKNSDFIPERSISVVITRLQLLKLRIMPSTR